MYSSVEMYPEILIFTGPVHSDLPFKPPKKHAGNPHWTSYFTKEIFTRVAVSLENGDKGIRIEAKSFSVTFLFIKYAGSYVHRSAAEVRMASVPMIFVRIIYDYPKKDGMGFALVHGESPDEILALAMREVRATSITIDPKLLAKLNDCLTDELKALPRSFTTFILPFKMIEDPSAGDSAMKICFNCHKQRAGACKRCGAIRYCSKFCQEQDWPRHRAVCF